MHFMGFFPWSFSLLSLYDSRTPLLIPSRDPIPNLDSALDSALGGGPRPIVSDLGGAVIGPLRVVASPCVTSLGRVDR